MESRSYFDVTVKNREGTYENIIEMSKNNDYTTGNLLNCEYFSKHYRLITVDLSKQIKLENSDLKQLILLVSLKKIMEQ